MPSAIPRPISTDEMNGAVFRAEGAVDGEVTRTVVPTMPVRIAWTIVTLAVIGRGLVTPFHDRRWGLRSVAGAKLSVRHRASKSDPAQKVKTPGVRVIPRSALVD